MEILVPYESSKIGRELFLDFISESVKNQLTFKIEDPNVMVKVEPSLATKTKKIVSDSKESSDKPYPLVECDIPPTESIEITWTPLFDENDTIEENLNKEEIGRAHV